MSVSQGKPIPPAATIASVAALRARLWDAGFRPVAVYNAVPGHEDSGKNPIGDGWQNRARENPPEAAERTPDMRALNSGILCDGLRAIDIDVEDREIVAQLKAAILHRWGEAPIRYRRNSARVLIVYRAAEGEPAKRKLTGTHGKIEVLGRGNQFVGFGTHWSGATLEWVGEAPGDISLREVPAITEDDVSKLFRFAEKLIDAKPENYRNGAGAVSVHGRQAADALQVVAAMCAIPNTGPADWEAWNRVGMALWAATDGSEAGRAAWHAWSMQHPSYDPAHAAERWDNYRTSPPTKIGAGTLFHMARQSSADQPSVEAEAPPAWHDDIPPPNDLQDYDEVSPPDSEPGKTALMIIRTPWAEADIATRPWVAKGYFLRGAVSALSGMGSAGKSSLYVAWSVAAALGLPFGRFRPIGDKPLRVINYNVEDDADEQRRRYSAIARQFGVPIESILKNLLIVTPRDIGTLLQTTRDGQTIVNTQAMNELLDIVTEFKPDLNLLDPFVELHTAEENDNTAIRAVMARFRSLSVAAKCATGILMHTRKGAASPGDPDQIRGASAIVGAVRVAMTLTVMSPEEADKLGIPPESRRDYFRLDGAKKNYSRLEDAEWFERLEYTLDNGDQVAMPYPWEPAGTTSVAPEATVDLIEWVAKGAPSGPWSSRLGDSPRSLRIVLERLGIDKPQAQKAAIAALMRSGMVENAPYLRPRRAASDPDFGLRTKSGEPRHVRWLDGKGESNA